MVEKKLLGTTGIKVGRVGISTSFGADVEVYEEAFDRGCNYFTWGTFVKGRSETFKTFLQNLQKSGRREEIFLSLLSYSHSSFLSNWFLRSALRKLRTEYVDCLLLGYFNRKPSNKLLDWAVKTREKGLIRHIGLTTHNRKIVVPLLKEGIIDICHCRYNLVHRGAEQDIFPHLQKTSTGIVSFTATYWGKVLKEKNVKKPAVVPTAGDCYRFVLQREEVDVCMMGVRDLEMLRGNFSEIAKGPLSLDEMERLRTVGSTISN